ncbi:hypothetical protein SKAU_G00313850 [Synaphobranchus kaupii]|uniref:non-specific serine/threonine protein kinase n=1 Tax=Synaphobranchus kaupii TaxID=118154 RepID=A0A9Q1ES87_SYNKA|nr:hypothetical protein SKAU_G00313850 [Synaphobranchus kaupii]
MNGKDVPSNRDLSTCQCKEEVQHSASTAEHVKAEAGDTRILKNHIHSASGAPSQNTQFYSNVLDESQKKRPNGPGMPGLDSTADPEDTSDCPVMPVVKPGLAELPVDTAAEKDRGINVSVGEIQTSNLRSQDNNAPCVQEPAEKVGGEIWVNAYPEKETKTQGSKGMTETAAGAEKKAKMEGKEIPMYAAHENENRRLPWVQDRISPENNQPSKDEVKELDSLVTLLQGVMNDLDSCVTLSAVGEKEINLTPCCVEEATPTNDSDMLLGITTPKTGMKQTPSSVSESPLEKVLPCADVIVTQPDEEQQPKQSQAASDTFTGRHIKDKSGLYKNNPINPESPLLSATTPRRDPARDTPAIPAIRVDSVPFLEKWSGEGTVGDTFPPPELSCESSPQLRKRDSLTPIPSATPEELASGARRKIFIPKSKMEEVEASPGLTEALAKKEEVPKRRTPSQEQEAPYMSPSQSRRPSFLQLPTGQQTPPLPRRSPLLGRKKTTLEVPKCPEEIVKEPDNIKTESKSEKDKLDPLKAPRVIRKVRAEPFPDNVGHLKLCCQFFNVFSDSTIKWCRDETEIVEVNRSAGDESQVALAIVQVSSTDCGVYSCSIKNEYGTDSTDFLLSAAILPKFLLRADLEVGQEIEMTPMLFTKGLADPGCWGNKFFGRIMITESHIGDGCTRKACRIKVIYGLEPAFESGSTCIIKVGNPISYGKKDENNLVERNLEITQQECKVQNIIREYCKVFSTEARVAGNFGPVLEVIPLYLMYQPANTIPYTTAEADLKGVFLKHCLMDATGRLIMRTGSEVAQICCTFQHWIHQWTNGNLLLTQLEGVDGKITNVRVATKLMGYQGLSDKATPKVFEQFVTQHQCNDHCSLLGLRSLKVMDSLAQPTKTKGPRSPMLNRRGSPSPQMLRKGGASPQAHRKVSSSPRLTRRSSEPGDGKPAVKNKTVEVPKVVSTS